MRWRQGMKGIRCPGIQKPSKAEAAAKQPANAREERILQVTERNGQILPGVRKKTAPRGFKGIANGVK